MPVLTSPFASRACKDLSVSSLTILATNSVTRFAPPLWLRSPWRLISAVQPVGNLQLILTETFNCNLIPKKQLSTLFVCSPYLIYLNTSIVNSPGNGMPAVLSGRSTHHRRHFIHHHTPKGNRFYPGLIELWGSEVENAHWTTYPAS